MSPCLVSSGGSAGGRTPVTTVSLQSLQPLSLPRPPCPTPPLQRGGAGHVTTAAVTAALPARLSRARTSGDTTPRDNNSSNSSSSNNTCCRITADNTVN